MSSKISFTEYFNIVNGEQRTAKTFYQGLDPSTGEKLWDTPVASKQDVDDAVIAARVAFKTWSNIPFEERIKVLKDYGQALQPYLAELEELLMKESGKPRLFAKGETHSSCVDAFEFFLSLKLPAEIIKETDREAHVTYTPLGVVASILPWNFPLGQATMKFLPALLAGNAVIVKPSPFTPYSALKVVELSQNILPPGLLQIMGGDDKLGPWLTHHPDINKISFTGSIGTGKRVLEAASKTLKRVTLELGGNDACIICPDVDIQKIAYDVVFGAMFNTGQICTATKRIYIHKDIYPEMLVAMAAALNKLKTGDVGEEGVLLGPLQNKMQYEKVKNLYGEASENSFKVEFGSEVRSSRNGGFFLRPCIIDSPPSDSLIVAEEQMGPIVPTQPWSDEKEVIERANSAVFGLGASVWSNDPVRAQRIADQLDAGSIFINSGPKLSIHIPFSGHKESGLGIEGGPDSLKSYCNQKVIHHFK